MMDKSYSPDPIGNAIKKSLRGEAGIDKVLVDQSKRNEMLRNVTADTMRRCT